MKVTVVHWSNMLASEQLAAWDSGLAIDNAWSVVCIVLSRPFYPVFCLNDQRISAILTLWSNWYKVCVALTPSQHSAAQELLTLSPVLQSCSLPHCNHIRVSTSTSRTYQKGFEVGWCIGCRCQVWLPTALRNLIENSGRMDIMGQRMDTYHQKSVTWSDTPQDRMSHTSDRQRSREKWCLLGLDQTLCPSRIVKGTESSILSRRQLLFGSVWLRTKCSNHDQMR